MSAMMSQVVTLRITWNGESDITAPEFWDWTAIIRDDDDPPDLDVSAVAVFSADPVRIPPTE
jgi:hypothetical protein